MNKITQDVVDGVFFIRMQNSGQWTDKDTLCRIVAALKEHGIVVSMAEAHEFWSWRSNKNNVPFIILTPYDHNEVWDWFQRFVRFTCKFEYTPEEDYSYDDLIPYEN